MTSSTRSLRRSAAAWLAAICAGAAPVAASSADGRGQTEAGPFHEALDARTFLRELGVNTHLSWRNTPYANLANVVRQLDYLGVRNLRDDFGAGPQGRQAVNFLMAHGFRFDLISGGDTSAFLDASRKLALAHPQGLAAIEGPNEVDGWPIRRPGETVWRAAADYQRELFTRSRADPVLAHVPVYNLSVASVTASRNLGDLSAYADYANLHLYFGAGQPAYGWSPHDSTFYWTNWVEAARRSAPGRPLVLTEIGSSATPAWGGGVDEATQARQILNALMDAARTRTSATYIYELIDSRNKGPADEQSHYGLFRWDGAPRPAAVAVHNLTEILGVRGPHAAVRATASPDYTIRGTPQWGGHLLFLRDDGARLIAVWAEPDIWDEKAKAPIPPPLTPVSIELPRVAHVSIYDPLKGRLPVQVLGNARRVDLKVTDHPVIVELTNPK